MEKEKIEINYTAEDLKEIQYEKDVKCINESISRVLNNPKYASLHSAFCTIYTERAISDLREKGFVVTRHGGYSSEPDPYLYEVSWGEPEDEEQA